MAEVIWTARALRDVDQVQQFIGRDSRAAAQRVARQIYAATRRLDRFPMSGRMVQEFGDPAYRELIIGRYRVIYRYQIEPDRVEIVMVVHGSRLLPSADDHG